MRNTKLQNLLETAEKIEHNLNEKGIFSRIEKIAFQNQIKVMNAFQKFRVSDTHFAGTTGYGYDDRGREVLDKLYAELFECESAFVRHSIVSGTHALCIGLFGLLRPNDTMLSITGKPYDTLEEVIGLRGNRGNGSLADFGVNYKQIDLKNGSVNLDCVDRVLKEDKNIKVVFLQRSKGYSIRPTFCASQIGEIADFVHSRNKDVFVVVDNCYGEFSEEHEPTFYGADLIIGSLIKNPGGGMAESGAYIAGTAKAVELCSYRLTSPGVGCEVGASLGQNKNMIKGLFYAPHTVCEAIKTAVFAAALFEEMGYEVYPKAEEPRYDIIQTISLGSKEKLLSFCKGIQSGSPIDSHVVPEGWDMPGYAVPVVMAAGAFTQGASIELSADAPVIPPYTVYLQGGLTYQSGKLGVLYAANCITESGD